METVVSNPYWVMRVYREHKLVQIQRRDAPFETLFDLEVSVDCLLQRLGPDLSAFGAVVDMRGASIRWDTKVGAQSAGRRARAAFDATFARISLLVKSHTAMVAANQLIRDEGSKCFVTMSETAAFEYAKGLAVACKPPKSRNEMPRIASPEPTDDALHWATELDEWAVVREKVLTKIDIRAARRARALASEIRRVADITLDQIEGENDDIGKIAPLLDELAALRVEAVELMLGSTPPPRRSSPPSGVSIASSGDVGSLGHVVRTLDRAAVSAVELDPDEEGSAMAYASSAKATR